MAAPAIVWFQCDLRLTDHPALSAAAKEKQPLIFLYILDEKTRGLRKLGGAAKWWLHHSLASLERSLNSRGMRLVLRRGKAGDVLDQLVAQTRASAVFCSRSYEPGAKARQETIKRSLGKRGASLHLFEGILLTEPWEITTASDAPYRVYTPFWRKCLKILQPNAPLPVPEMIPFKGELFSDALERWQLLPKKPDWASGLRNTWTPGEPQAQKQLNHFIEKALARYEKQRDIPSEAGTSFLSPHLHWGEISPRQIWHAVQRWISDAAKEEKACADLFLAEIGWREFCHYLLYHFPHLQNEPFDERFKQFTWDNSERRLHAWQQGKTGYPIVDAGMRQLWQIGWMHNRVRMIVASFLTKDLLIHWRNGESWFWDTLVDADLANNAANWQWVAGSGADAAPYFRIFNPALQAKRFDPEGKYVRRYIPELSKLPSRYLHTPWQASEKILAESNVVLGKTYPKPIVDHKEQRKRALVRFQSIVRAHGI